MESSGNTRAIIFSSRTGSDAQYIIDNQKSLGITVVSIITNNDNFPLKFNEDLIVPIVVIPKKPDTINYEQVLDCFSFDVILLMGYTRIIPKWMCNKYEIYNLHPGDIVKYPQLKGKDPQQKAYDLCLDTTGIVIHKVTPEVDDGEILHRMTCIIDYRRDLDYLYQDLAFLAKVSWKKFLEKRYK